MSHAEEDTPDSCHILYYFCVFSDHSKQQKSGTMDNFSCWPEDLILYMLQYISLEDLCKTCILSRQWKRR